MRTHLEGHSCAQGNQVYCSEPYCSSVGWADLCCLGLMEEQQILINMVGLRTRTCDSISVQEQKYEMLA